MILECSTWMPAEWHPHQACMIIYPHNTGVFRNSEDEKKQVKCGPAREEVRNVAMSIRDYGKEDVMIFCNSEKEAKELRESLKKDDDHSENGNLSKNHVENKISVSVCKSDDSWCRDTGPTFVFGTPKTDDTEDHQSSKQEKVLVALDWDFNAYGGKEEGCYWPCDLDRAFAKSCIPNLSSTYYSLTPMKHLPVNLILEGGSIHVDGEGTIMATEECLLNKNRNPHLSKSQIEETLFKYLGASKMIWLPFGLAFDNDTNGHVDNIATFANPAEVVLSWTNDTNDENYPRFLAAFNILCKETDAKGRKFKVYKLNVPNPMFYTEKEITSFGEAHDDNSTMDMHKSTCDRSVGERLAASYVNYYHANKAIILPQFGDEVHDRKAKEMMKQIFPDKEIVGVYSREILLGGGNIHCITQQIPRVL
mmetsp:Transcript_14898/g.21328  ORF Transcript_14898/g.21328 Transcript_14898/m.21328 type:complete len:421 (-) Transcript_14898:181-1443(-)